VVVVVVVVVVPEELELLDESSSFAQEMMVKLKRNMEKMMSRCFTWFPIGGLGEPNIYQNLGEFTRIGDFTWSVSDCEGLSGNYLEGV